VKPSTVKARMALARATAHRATPIDRVAVVGAGTIGIGVAQLMAERGVPVTLIDRTQDALDRALAQMRDNRRALRLLNPSATGDRDDVMEARMTVSTSYAALEAVPLVIENVPEHWSIKAGVYRRLDRICDTACVFAANTSTFSIAAIASLTSRPTRVLGMHFMNPPSLRPVVELIPAPSTARAVVTAAEQLLARLGMRYVRVRDNPGFVTNRLLMAFVNDAAAVVADGVASAKEVDLICRLCFGHRMGPLETGDLIGIDTVVLSLRALRRATGDDRYKPHPLLLALRKRGWLGRKTGRGFHHYATA
jgi:3-hydroxybutyryl-CoA dehydrogenase